MSAVLFALLAVVIVVCVAECLKRIVRHERTTITLDCWWLDNADRWEWLRQYELQKQADKETPSG